MEVDFEFYPPANGAYNGIYRKYAMEASRFYGSFKDF
jgi:hypothetical protein